MTARSTAIEARRLIDGIKSSVQARGVVVTAGRVASVIGGQAAFPMIVSKRRSERFHVGGREMHYELARFNNTFKNERCVEVALARNFLHGQTGKVLEIGNVLSHYGVTGQDVLDKYEDLPGIINEDIVEFRPKEPYDAVVTLSTLEHVGWDETPRNPPRVREAFASVIAAAGATGEVLITTPLGYNDELDAFLSSAPPAELENYCLVRASRQNRWEEASIEEGTRRRYNTTYPNANAIYVGWRRNSRRLGDAAT